MNWKHTFFARTVLTIFLSYPLTGMTQEPWISELLKKQDDPNFETRLRKLVVDTQPREDVTSKGLSQLSAAAAAYGNFFLFGKDTKNLLEVHKKGMDWAEQAWKKDAENGEAHFWFTLNLGFYAMAKGILSSLGEAKNMLNHCNIALQKNPEFLHGGPYRVRAALYYEVPSIISFGDKKQALADIKKAIEIAPNYPWNKLWLSKIQRTEVSKETARITFKEARVIPEEFSKLETARYQKDLKELEDKLF